MEIKIKMISASRTCHQNGNEEKARELIDNTIKIL